MNYSYNEWKESELGKIPKKWEIKTIGECLYVKARIGWKGLKKSEYEKKSKYRIINGSALDGKNIEWEKCGYITEARYEESPEIMLQENDIVMTKDGTIGKIAIIKNLDLKTTVASGLFVIRVINNEIDYKYLYYYFISKSFKELINSRIEGSVIPHLYQRDLVDLKVAMPNIKEQKAIAKILSDLDEKIEINNKINKNLEEIAQTIFKRWFVDFEFPNEEGKPYKSSGGEMVESELGMIPKGWKVSSLLNEFKYLNGLAMQKYRPIEGEKELKVLKIKELRQGFVDENSDVCSREIKKEYIINDGDVIFSWSGTLLIDLWGGGKCGLNQHLFKVTGGKYSKWYYYYWTKMHLNKFVAIAKDKATTMGHIKREDLKKSIILIPDELELRKMDNIMDHIIDKIVNNKIENKKLEKVRDILLPKLMSGEIRVK